VRPGIAIRPEEPGDAEGVFAVHEAAFGGAAEARLVAALREEGDLALGLTAFGDRPVGHIAFPRLTLEGSDLKAVALAPLAILPAFQNHGIGTALVEAALRMLRERGEDLVWCAGTSPIIRASASRPISRAVSAPPTMGRACTPWR
jgi:putative acetyltransferase